MKRLGIIILLLLFFSNSKAQVWDFCGTSDSFPNFLDTVSYAPTKVANNEPYVVRLFVHIVRDSKCKKGLTDQQVADAINILIEDFSPHGICFMVADIDEICDSVYYVDLNVDSSEHIALFKKYSQGIGFFGVDVFLLGPDSKYTGTSGGGIAEFFPGSAFLVAGNASDIGLPNVIVPVSHYISHEMGHCLGLYHTFRGSCNWDACQEDPGGTNCNTCGDLVCDTPADPQWFGVDPITCVWDSLNKNNTYCVGKVHCSYKNIPVLCYHPDTSNIMAYISPICMNHFTPGQGKRMREMLNYRPPEFFIPDSLVFDSLIVTNGKNEHYEALNYISAKKVIVDSSSSLILKAGKRITVKDPSKIDGYFLAKIDTICNSVSAVYVQRTLRRSTKKIAYDELESITGINIYPNPTSQILYIETPYEFKYEIYDLPGNKIKSGVANVGKNEVEVSGFAKGMYIIKTGNGKVFKFVKAGR